VDFNHNPMLPQMSPLLIWYLTDLHLYNTEFLSRVTNIIAVCGYSGVVLLLCDLRSVISNDDFIVAFSHCGATSNSNDDTTLPPLLYTAFFPIVYESSNISSSLYMDSFFVLAIF